MRCDIRFLCLLVVFGFGACVSSTWATPYASNVKITGGTSVSFILNQPSASLTYSINGGAPVALDGSGKGTKTFNLGSPTDHFSIKAEDTAATGFLIPTGGTVVAVGNGLTVDAPAAGFNLISDDSSILSRYNSPRGLDVNKYANTPNFGTVYINNTVGGTATATTTPPGPNAVNLVARTTTGKGLYALRADQTDAYGNGDAAVNPTNIDTFPAFATTVNSFGTSVANSGYRLRVGSDGTIWATDYSDVNGQLFQVQPSLAGGATTSVNIFAGFGGPATPTDAMTGNVLTADGTALQPDAGCPANKCTTAFQNHGSISSSWTTGSLATGDLVVYTLDEDLTSKHFGGTATDDRNSIWQYNIGSGQVGGSTVTPTQLAPGVPFPAVNAVPTGLIGAFPAGGIVMDMTRGPDGKFYVSENRSAGAEPGLLVFDTDGKTLLFNSLAYSKTTSADPAKADILTGVGGIDISPDGKYLATIQIDNDIALIPLVNGIPDLAHVMVVDNGTNTGNGRDIAFDAAGNLYYVSSGQGLYRVLSPGGHTITTLSWDGSQYAFNSQRITSSPGDYNGDGIVDARDYTIWQDTFGSTTDLRANGDNSGASLNVIDNADFLVWKNNFGAGQPGAGGGGLGTGQVPEPSTWLLAVIGLCAAGVTKRRRHRGQLETNA